MGIVILSSKTHLILFIVYDIIIYRPYLSLAILQIVRILLLLLVALSASSSVYADTTRTSLASETTVSENRRYLKGGKSKTKSPKKTKSPSKKTKSPKATKSPKRTKSPAGKSKGKGKKMI